MVSTHNYGKSGRCYVKLKALQGQNQGKRLFFACAVVSL